MLKPIIELIDGTAYRPDPANTESPLRERFAGRSMLGVCVNGRETVRVVLLKFGAGGQVTCSSPQQAMLGGVSDTGAVIQKLVLDAAAQHKTKNVLLLPTPGLFLALADHSYRGKDTDRNRLLAEDAKQVVGGQQSNATSVYAMISHPKLNRGIVFTADRPSLEESVSQLRSFGLTVSRAQPAMYSLLRWAIEEAGAQTEGKDILLVDDSAVCLVMASNGDWVDLGYKLADHVANDGLAKMVAELMERRTSEDAPLAWISTREFNPTEAGIPANAERLLPDVPADFVAACIEGPGRVSTDFNPFPMPIRPHLPGKYRIAASLAAVLIVAGLAGAIGLNFIQAKHVKETAAVTEESAQLADERTTYAGKLGKISNDRDRAERLGRWISLGLYAEPLVSAVVETAGDDVNLDEFAIALTPGSSQMEMRFVARGESRKVDNFISDLLTRLKEANFRLVNPEQSAVPGGVRFVGKFIYPSPLEANWKLTSK